MMGDESQERLEIDRLIAGMRGDGVPLPTSVVLEAVEHPRWEGVTGPRDWRAYVPRAVRRGWSSLPLTARLCVFETAELIALDTEPGAAMVTGPTRTERSTP